MKKLERLWKRHKGTKRGKNGVQQQCPMSKFERPVGIRSSINNQQSRIKNRNPEPWNVVSYKRRHWLNHSQSDQSRNNVSRVRCPSVRRRHPQGLETGPGEPENNVVSYKPQLPPQQIVPPVTEVLKNSCRLSQTRKISCFFESAERNTDCVCKMFSKRRRSREKG